ncbi:hypothetical protein BD769DRAFT_1371467 [Suillus cothurnatus]|nr:hypothetical protein BD769DRAFT_1371467 [Suillus cothurnatus]
MHSISYAAQSLRLHHQSIKHNILFGQPFDEERYNDVVELCAAAGCVALVCAVYARTKYVLLDDPLSAVVSVTTCLFICHPRAYIWNRTVVLAGSV